jgi:hypothetical protein
MQAFLIYQRANEEVAMLKVNLSFFWWYMVTNRLPCS